MKYPKTRRILQPGNTEVLRFKQPPRIDVVNKKLFLRNEYTLLQFGFIFWLENSLYTEAIFTHSNWESSYQYFRVYNIIFNHNNIAKERMSYQKDRWGYEIKADQLIGIKYCEYFDFNKYENPFSLYLHCLQIADLDDELKTKQSIEVYHKYLFDLLGKYLETIDERNIGD